MAQHTDRKASPIMAMHQRYEETMAEYLVVEKAETAAGKERDDNNVFALKRASKALVMESDALRVAILHQVPHVWTEAMVLQFHIVNAYDLQASCDGTPDSEQAALQTAIDTLFDFMCCEVDQDQETLGESFQDGANRVFEMRRYRTGVVEN